MKILFIGLFCLFSVQSQSSNFNPSRIIVKLKEGNKVPTNLAIKKVQHLFNNLYVLHLNENKSAAFELLDHNAFEYVERDYYSDRTKLPEPDSLEDTLESSNLKSFNDPKIKKQWYLNNSKKNGMSVNVAYEDLVQVSGEEVIVAVVDTGIDYNHKDLKANLWVNTGEIPDNGIDDDQNGYVDDVHGISTLDRDDDGNATGDMMDTHNHGTHVAGVIGAVQNNDIGIAGVARNVKIIGIRTVPNTGDELDVDVIESFLYAAKNGAKIINCSFGKKKNEGGLAVSETIKHIGEKYGVLVITSAGNSTQNIDTTLTYPASYDNETMLVVASTTKRGRLSSFSNYGLKNVDIAAPGSRIYSTVRKNKYANYSGTSMASPAVSGVAAEVLSQSPSLTPIELKRVLMKTTDKKNAYKKKVVSGGSVNLYEALKKSLNL